MLSGQSGCFDIKRIKILIKSQYKNILYPKNMISINL